ncbi:MAG: AbrB/MazE/SpoVT family DNA-binding domain-containing protein [Sphaerochaetaceae bacterium]
MTDLTSDAVTILDRLAEGWSREHGWAEALAEGGDRAGALAWAQNRLQEDPQARAVIVAACKTMEPAQVKREIRDTLRGCLYDWQDARATPAQMSYPYQLKKIGNSLMVTVPVQITRTMKLGEGDTVQITVAKMTKA